MKIRDNRAATSREIGDILITEGDASLGCFSTDKGYRLIIDSYNLKVLHDFYKKERGERKKGELE